MTDELDLGPWSGIDFDAEVFVPCVETFGRPVIVTPRASQPTRAAGSQIVPQGRRYVARGIWSSRPIDVATETGIMSSQSQTLDIRALDFEVPIAPGDLIEIPAIGSLQRVGLCEVEDTDDNGQGGTSLSLKIVGP